MEGIACGLHIGRESTHNKEINAKGRNKTKEKDLTWGNPFIVHHNLLEKNTVVSPKILSEILNTYTQSNIHAISRFEISNRLSPIEMLSSKYLKSNMPQILFQDWNLN